MLGKEFAFKNRFFSFSYALLVFAQNLVSVALGGEKCLCCSRRSVRIPICKACLPKILEVGFKNSCAHCGRELVSEIDVCSYCRENPALQSLSGAFSLHGYQLWKKSLLFAWKLEDKRNLSPYFAAIFYKKLSSLEKELGARLPVVPVPPRAGKIREKGWDQIEELCFYLEKGWNVRILPLLERLSRIQQKKLDRAKRIEGISSSYKARSKKEIRKICPEIPEKAVLADDIFTTGATMEACARELRLLGVREVFSITLFIAD